MAAWTPDNLSTKGSIAAFHEGFQATPTVWQNHCQRVDSTTKTETYVWPGVAPRPREFLDMRSIQGLNDFTWDKASNTYELTINLKRQWFEDDQHGLMMARMRELGEIWAEFKDYTFCALVTAGQSSTAHPYYAYTGATNKYFFDDDHSWNSTGTIDNKMTAAATSSSGVPYGEEFLKELNLVKAQFLGFNSDQGQPFNAGAVRNLRILVPPILEAPAREAIAATTIPGESTYGSRTNVFTGMAELDVAPWLTSGVVSQRDWYVSAVGSERKPYIYQERTPLEILMLTDANSVAENDGVLVLCRQRFVFTYGDLRRAIWHRFT